MSLMSIYVLVNQKYLEQAVWFNSQTIKVKFYILNLLSQIMDDSLDENL